MASELFFVYWHVERHGCSTVFEDDGSAAMKFAMNLGNMGYRCRVVKEVVGNQSTTEVVYESDNWLPLVEHLAKLDAGEGQEVRNHD